MLDPGSAAPTDPQSEALAARHPAQDSAISGIRRSDSQRALLQDAEAEPEDSAPLTPQPGCVGVASAARPRALRSEEWLGPHSEIYEGHAMRRPMGLGKLCRMRFSEDSGFMQHVYRAPAPPFARSRSKVVMRAWVCHVTSGSRGLLCGTWSLDNESFWSDATPFRVD